MVSRYRFAMKILLTVVFLALLPTMSAHSEDPPTTAPSVPGSNPVVWDTPFCDPTLNLVCIPVVVQPTNSGWVGPA